MQLHGGCFQRVYRRAPTAISIQGLSEWSLSQMLNVPSNDDWLQIGEEQMTLIAPEAKLSDGSDLGTSSVGVSDVGGEELQEAAHRTFTRFGDDAWEGLTAESEFGRWSRDEIVIHSGFSSPWS